MRRFLWRKREFYRIIWRCFARVKYGSVMSGFRKCCDCRQIHLLCEKSHVCGWARVTRKLCDKHKKTKNASCVLSVGDFVLQSLFCAQRLWILNLVFFSNGPRGLTTKTLCFCDVSNSLFISSQNTVTSAREINRLLPAIKLWLLRPFTFSVRLRCQIVKMQLPRFSKYIYIYIYY